jgi:hypothetical protein
MTDDQHHEGHPEELTLLDYVVGDLGPDSSDAIRRHVETCPSCRERIIDLATDLDELDRLPSVAIPHDLLRDALRRSPGARRRGIARRIAPFLILAAVGIAVVALFQLGGVRAPDAVVTQRQVVLQTTSSDPVRVVDDLLGTLPHTVVVDRADPRHLVVLVADADVGVAYSSLIGSSVTGGQSYVIDVAATGAQPASAN